MRKSETLAGWRELDGKANPLAEMMAIPYKANGSKYGSCGVRIDGTPEFIDAVLGKLKDLLDGENAFTRLELSRSSVKPTEINGEVKHFINADRNAEVCYIRLHERGGDAQHVNASGWGDKSLQESAKRYESLPLPVSMQKRRAR